MSETKDGMGGFKDSDGGKRAEDRLSRERPEPRRRYRTYAVVCGQVVWKHEWPKGWYRDR